MSGTTPAHIFQDQEKWKKLFVAFDAYKASPDFPKELSSVEDLVSVTAVARIAWDFYFFKPAKPPRPININTTDASVSSQKEIALIRLAHAPVHNVKPF